ncbi:MAG: galactonate dehydratase [Chloroflexota bacterium]|nr:galactonate dehydratase [Chloroflexota bacterium]
MKITKLQCDFIWTGSRNWLIVRVHTDAGITGIGEAFPIGPDRAIAETVDYFQSWIEGWDPFDIERVWHELYAGSRFPTGSIITSAISGIDQALWDIKGRALGVPVFELLGGKVRDRIRVYQSPEGETPAALADDARRLVERYGFTALKIGPFAAAADTWPWSRQVDSAEERLAAVRDAVGPDIDIGVDPHAKIFEPMRALEMAERLKPYRPMFFEEPVRPENFEALAKLTAKSPIPIATGEAVFTKFQFRDLLATGAADIIQPDMAATGGLTEMKKIAAMAEAHYVSVAPHNPLGPLATTSNVHFAATAPNFLILEYHADDVGLRAEILHEPLKLEDGYVVLPDAPGLGVELNEEVFEKYPYRPWRRGRPTKSDGMLAFI